MRPMMSYMGGKYRLSGRMGPPRHDLVIEPFAGGAAYSLRYEPKKVLLVEKNPVVAAVWRYMISVSAREILSLPIMFDHVDDLNICQEAKWMIGFWLACGISAPRSRRSKWAVNHLCSNPSSVWSEKIRQRIADQVGNIRHWKIIEGDYTLAPDIEAHWVIDPPYQVAGHNYPVHDIDYNALSEWCKSRQGTVFVHEAEGAEWLPFQPFHVAKATNGKHRKGVSREVIWTNKP